MKAIIVAVTCLALGFGLAQVIMMSANQAAQPQGSVQKQLYTCGMHPQVISDEPGYCPICEMKLVPKKDGGSDPGGIAISPVTRQNMGLVTAPAQYRKLVKSVRAFGRVTYSEPKIYSVNLKIDGWVERLYIDYEGAYVEDGQPLIEIYSPELVAAQKEFLIAMESSQSLGMPEFLEGARQRLLNWDISADQIERLALTREIVRTMIIRAPVGGVVFSKMVEAGDHLKAGTELYQIADPSTVWVVAYVYEQDLPFISLGQQAGIEFPSLAGRKISAIVSYISPHLDSKRQAEIRLDVDNQGYQLKPEMYAEVTIRSEMPGEILALPRSAVINSGKHEVVYVASMDGTFSPRLIETGLVGDSDLVEVKSGLAADEWVVTRGQFLLDSESRLSEALGQAHTHSGQIPFASGPKPIMASGVDSLSGVYTCPMTEHYHVLQYGEGKCPECGMNLVPVEETDNHHVFVCPMKQCGIARNNPGECPVCGMNLVRLQREIANDR